ncbi:MAG: AAA family ATPase [Hyphomicrobium sp.]
MKLLSLNINRYAHFSDRTLVFNPNAKLHVVYGPNEAGKSCALAAVTDLLFGFDTRTVYDFQHASKDLRIGASIRSSNGTELTFRRRKGLKNTLLSASSDVPIPDDALTPFLGGLTRDVFCNAFGLNAETLRRGADEMLKSEGEVGASLFAAASGLRGLNDLRRRLENEADGIFSPRYSKDRLFHQAFDRFELAKKSIREHELKGGEWKELNERIVDLVRQQDEIDAQRASKKQEWAASSRLKRVAAPIRLIDDELKKIEALGPLPEVPQGFPQQLGAALDHLAVAKQIKDRSELSNQAAIEEYANIVVDDRLLSRADEIAQLFADTGKIIKSQLDLPSVQRELGEITTDLENLGRRVGLTDSQSVVASQPTDAAQTLVRTLIAEHRSTEGKFQSLTEALSDEEENVARIEQLRKAGKHLVDPSPMQARLRAFSPILKKIDNLKDQETEAKALALSINEAQRRLTPSVGSIDTLAVAGLPSAETVSKFRRGFDDIDRRLDRERDRLTEVKQSAAATENALKKAQAGPMIASPEAIAAERQKRQIAWVPLRNTLFEGPEPLSGSALAAVVSDLEHHTGEADRLADQALVDKEQIVRQVALESQFKEHNKRLKEATDSVKALETEHKSQVSSWLALWDDAGVAPLAPAEMLGWLESVQRILRSREDLRALRVGCTATAKELENIMPALRQLISDVGAADTSPLTAETAAALIEARLREMTEAWNQTSQIETKLSVGRERISKLTNDKTKLGNALNEWGTRWNPALRPLNLPEAATLEMAEATLEVWRQVPGKIGEQTNRRSRVVGMTRDIEIFESAVSSLVTDVAPDLASLTPLTAIKAINTRLGEATSAAARRSDAAKRKDDANIAYKTACSSTAEAEAALSRISAILPDGSNLDEMRDRIAQRETARSSLDGLRRQLIDQSDGHDETDLRADLLNFDPDATTAKIAALETDEQVLELKAKALYSQHEKEAATRASLETGIGAELSAFQRRSAEAELVEASRSWVILKLGSLLITTAVERHRASKQDPLMERAAHFFAMITGAAYTGLDQELDDKDVPHLIGRRATGGIVKIPGMSEGTRDQLYLALRLAYLEEYAVRSEPVPFIGDDLCTTFDEARAANAISALAELGNVVQPILFTHHQHVVNLARERLGDAVDIVDMS